MSLTVQRLFIYPIKSLRPVEVNSAELTDAGLRFDRSFALVYAQPEVTTSPSAPPLVRHLTIKRTFALALFQPEIDSTWSKLTIRYLGADEQPAVTIPLVPSPMSSVDAVRYKLSIFGSVAIGTDTGSDTATFFSKYLSIDTRLVFIGASGRRELPGARYAPDWLNSASENTMESGRAQKIRFADASPLLVTSTASENEVLRRLPDDQRHQDVIIRFRPNIHVDVADVLPAWDEDRWRVLNIGNVDPPGMSTIRCVYPCVRCLSINADPSTGQMSRRDEQLYGLLARDRRINEAFPHKPVFGQYAFGFPYGFQIRVGDPVTIVERSLD